MHVSTQGPDCESQSASLLSKSHLVRGKHWLQNASLEAKTTKFSENVRYVQYTRTARLVDQDIRLYDWSYFHTWLYWRFKVISIWILINLFLKSRNTSLVRTVEGIGKKDQPNHQQNTVIVIWAKSYGTKTNLSLFAKMIDWLKRRTKGFD